MLSKQQIRAIIEAQGLNGYFRENINRRGDGTSRTYIQACKYVRGRGNVHIALGRIENVEQMSQNELIKTIQQKFAEKLTQKSQTVAHIGLKNGRATNSTNEDSSIKICQ